MLRIITEQNDGAFRLELHGSVAGEWIPILERHWRGLQKTAPSAVITVGVSNVMFIDSEGERLLRRMAASGVRFEGEGCMNRYVIEKVSGGM